MNEQKEREVICSALDEALSGVEALPSVRARVLDNIKGEKKVKKKLSLGLIIAIALLLAALTGIALTVNHEYFEKIGQMQVESGYYDDWTLEEKLQMLTLMEKYGVLQLGDEKAVVTARDEKLSFKEREDALDAFMAEKYGIYGRTDVIGLESIMEKEKGSVFFWTVEEKAWYTSFQKDLGLLSSDEERYYHTPSKDELSQDEAEALAREHLKSLQAPWCNIASSVPAVNFSLVQYYEETTNTWEVTFYDPDTDAELFVTLPSAKNTTAAQVTSGRHYLYDSTVLTPWREKYQHLTEDDVKSDTQKKYEELLKKYGPAETWDMNVLHEYLPDTYFLPDENDLSPDMAAQRGLAILTEAFPQKAASFPALTPSLRLVNALNTRAYIYQLSDEKDTILFYTYFDSRTGEKLNARANAE